MTMINPDDGVPAGTYQVAVIEERKPINGDWARVKPALLDGKYGSLTTSGLTATVSTGKNPVTFTLERKR
jgi:hypothetical protein